MDIVVHRPPGSVPSENASAVHRRLRAKQLWASVQGDDEHDRLAVPSESKPSAYPPPPPMPRPGTGGRTITTHRTKPNNNFVEAAQGPA